MLQTMSNEPITAGNTEVRALLFDFGGVMAEEGFREALYLIAGRQGLERETVYRAGVDADLHVYEGQAHGDYIFVMNAPESHEHYAELNAFVLKHLQSPLQPAQLPGVEGLEDIQVPDTAHY